MAEVARNEIEARRRAAAELRLAGLEEEASVLDGDAKTLDDLTLADIKHMEIRKNVAINSRRFVVTVGLAALVAHFFGWF